MADQIVSKPYEILLRFCCENGEVAGQLRGCHRVMQTLLVDENGIIKGRVDTSEPAADFPADELAKYLGSAFVDFNTQVERERAGRLAAETKLASLKQDAQRKPAAPV